MLVGCGNMSDLVIAGCFRLVDLIELICREDICVGHCYVLFSDKDISVSCQLDYHHITVCDSLLVSEHR